MFELGLRLRRESPEPVYDLSLGNPHLEPSARWRRALIELLENEPPGQHRYMPNAGFPAVRDFIAQREGRRFGLPIQAEDVFMTVGAAGGLAAVFRALIDPGEEVIVPAPYFTEYAHYCRVVGAKLVAVRVAPDFSLDVPAIERAISGRTRVLLLNSPNNPAGAVYTDAQLAELARALERAKPSRPIYVVEDSPYRDLVYDGTPAPSILGHYADTIHVTSYSKDLGLAGERIGQIVCSPRATDRASIRGAVPVAIRVLGFVNAPALMQRALPLVLDAPDGRADVSEYARNAVALASGLAPLGFEVVPPRGGMFLFPRVPRPWIDAFGDRADRAYVDRLAKERTLAVAGAAFGCPGHIRLALCVTPADIEGALRAFGRVPPPDVR
jgi:aspartate aminotransferase